MIFVVEIRKYVKLLTDGPDMNKINVYLMAAFYFLAGVYHFYNPFFYLKIIPLWLGNIEFLVAISGFIEIILGLALLSEQTRKISCWLIMCMLTVFLILVHIPMVIAYYDTGDSYLWLAVLRLPVQAVLVWWAWRISTAKRFR